MKRDNHKNRRSIVLWVLWLVSYLILSVLMFCTMVYQKVNHLAPRLILGLEKNFYLIFFLLIGYFLPLMFLVHKQSKCDEVQWLKIVSRIIMIFLLFISVMAVIVLLGAILLHLAG